MFRYLVSFRNRRTSCVFFSFPSLLFLSPSRPPSPLKVIYEAAKAICHLPSVEAADLHPAITGTPCVCLCVCLYGQECTNMDSWKYMCGQKCIDRISTDESVRIKGSICTVSSVCSAVEQGSVLLHFLCMLRSE
jgi:hypothetical protein